MHISTAQSSLGHLEPRGGSCGPPAVFSQSPAAQAACAVKGCMKPIPPENLGEMLCKRVVCMEQVHALQGGFVAVLCLLFPGQGLPGIGSSRGQASPGRGKVPVGVLWAECLV